LEELPRQRVSDDVVPARVPVLVHGEVEALPRRAAGAERVEQVERLEPVARGAREDPLVDGARAEHALLPRALDLDRGRRDDEAVGRAELLAELLAAREELRRVVEAPRLAHRAITHDVARGVPREEAVGPAPLGERVLEDEVVLEPPREAGPRLVRDEVAV